MSRKLKLINQLVEVLPEDNTETYPRVNFKLSEKDYASPIFFNEQDLNKSNIAAKVKLNKYSFSIPKTINKTITLTGTTNQTIILTYTEPGKSPVTVTSTSIDQNIKVQYGTTWTATIAGSEGYNPGTLSATSGTVTGNVTVSAGAATISGVTIYITVYDNDNVKPSVKITYTNISGTKVTTGSLGIGTNTSYQIKPGTTITVTGTIGYFRPDWAFIQIRQGKHGEYNSIKGRLYHNKSWTSAIISSDTDFSFTGLEDGGYND